MTFRLLMNTYFAKALEAVPARLETALITSISLSEVGTQALCWRAWEG